MEVGTERISGDELTETIDDVRGLFELTSDKDMFRTAYGAALAKRLLTGSSVSQEAERHMISRLKESEGMQFSMPLENMVTDFSTSGGLLGELGREWESGGLGALMAAGREAMQQSGLPPAIADPASSTSSSSRGGGGGGPRPSPFDFEVRVLCSAYWPQPSTDLSKLALPPAFAAGLSFTKSRYASRFESRKLDVLLTEGGAEIGYASPRGKGYALMVRPIQAAALLVLEGLWVRGAGSSSGSSSDGVTMGQLSTALGMEREMTIRTLHPLCFAKSSAVLEVRPAGGSADKAGAARLRKGKVIETDTIVPREAFASKFRAIQVPFLDPAPRKASTSDAQLDRRSVIDAAIVRVMKARKTLDMQELLPEVTRQIRLFQPDVRQIRQRVDHLIS